MIDSTRTPKPNQRHLFCAGLVVFLMLANAALAEMFLFRNGIIHTVSNGTITNGLVLVENGKITRVLTSDAQAELPDDIEIIDLAGQHLYPGLIALNTSLGLTEIESVRATRDAAEVGDYTPDVQSWIAVNPDSELIPVARANGIAYFEPAPKGSIVSGQSALLSTSGWTYEEMIVTAPGALHLVWPSMELNTTPKEKSRNPGKFKSLEDQAKERRSKVRSIEEFFAEAKAYAKASQTSQTNAANFNAIPAWEAMLPYVRGELPIMIHANDARQIRGAVHFARTNEFKIILAGGRDAWMIAELLATNRIPVHYESLLISPTRDTDSYDQFYRAPETLREAGVKVSFGLGTGGFATTSLRNLPYAAAQAIAFGLPESEALKALTLNPAEAMGVADRLGSIEVGKEATFFICDGNIFDLRSNVQRLWICGKEVSLENRHTRLYEKYRNRPKP